jgi:hypothetical protein
MTTALRTPRGRSITVAGDASLVTLERFHTIAERFDSDPRIASVSIVAHGGGEHFLRATAPAGCVVMIAADLGDVVGSTPGESASADEVRSWARRASERGLWHDWLLVDDAALRRAPDFLDASPMDVEERGDPSGSHGRAFEEPAAEGPLRVAIDITWLGPHETGAQVLTTAAIDALARHPGVSTIELFGAADLPGYARHLLSHASVSLGSTSRADVVWFPNQIDQRSSISDARARGRRIVTTYLDLIAYDIPRYHASHDAWSAYRRLQRRIALIVDGITTISADVAKRLHEEVPGLEDARILPVPLGLDHIVAEHVPTLPPAELTDLVQSLAGRPFVLVLGNDFQHKNRDFAIAVWQEVLRAPVSCDLVLAGLHVRGSSSRPEEERLLGSHVDLRGSAHLLDHVGHDARAWLLGNASAVLYPSSAEGFGFVPYEAAAVGVPTTFTSFGPLAELTGVRDVPGAWSVEDHARDLVMLLTDPAHRTARITRLQEAIAAQTWSRFADTLVEFFRRISAMPAVSTSAVGSDSTRDAAALAAVLSSRTWRVAERIRQMRPGSRST